jgi:hypothetical protein
MQDVSENKFISQAPLKTAVLFMLFNRLDTTKQVFEAIRRAKPPRLYVAADGPRDSKPDEDNKVKAVRDYVIGHIDWDCEVKTLFREKNLGCKYAVSGSIDWFFENEEMGIILEDDCLPHPSFFRFCEELLERYREDERIGIISGDNFQFGKRHTDDSYYFSRYTHIWGWASWRRTWQKYDVAMKQWPSIKMNGLLSDILQYKKLVKYWNDIFEDVFNNKIDTWDYQLNFACLINSMLNIMPNNNLISNIGFGANASRTTKINKFSAMPVLEMRFPLLYPNVIIRDALADRITERDQFSKSLIIAKIAKIIRRVIA